MQAAIEPPGTPWGIAAYIAKKDGVLGVLLLILCALIYNGQKKAEEAQKTFQTSQEKAFGQLLDAHNRTVTVTVQSIDAIRNGTAVADNTRRTLMFVERFHHPRAVMEN